MQVAEEAPSVVAELHCGWRKLAYVRGDGGAPGASSVGPPPPPKSAACALAAAT